MTRNRKKTMALILAALLCFFTLFSVYYVSSEGKHSCCCSKCEICHQISFLESVAKSLDSGLAGISAIFVSCLVIIYSLFIFDDVLEVRTPVSLKVKLTD